MSCPMNELQDLQQFLRQYCKTKKLTITSKEIFREYLRLNRRTTNSETLPKYPHILREIKYFFYLNKINGSIIQERKHKWKIVDYQILQFEWIPRLPHKSYKHNTEVDNDSIWFLEQYTPSDTKNEIDYLLDELKFKQNLKTPTNQT